MSNVVAFEAEQRGVVLSNGRVRKGSLGEFFPNGVPAESARLLVAYPALFRLCGKQIGNWIDFLGDFLRAARSFAQRRLGASDLTKIIRSVLPFLSDPHAGGRSVIRVDFVGGQSWHFKPRSGKHESGWFRLLAWLNREGFRPAFRIVKVHSGKTHCWVETVGHSRIPNKRAAELFYCRAGALIYLLNLLRAVDCHAGNLIACGAQPVLVDCETLRHVKTRVPVAHRLSNRGLFRTGMLPMDKAAADSRESSALGRLVRGEHSVILGHRVISPGNYARQVMDGYTAIHHFLTARTERRRRFENNLVRFFPSSSRTIYRPTTQYVEILDRSCSAGTMLHGLYRSLYLYACCRIGTTPARQIRNEVSALEDGDIPVFRMAAAAPHPLPSENELQECLSTLENSF